MTRDEMRAKCIEAVEAVLLDRWNPSRPITLLSTATAAFDALHGIACICPIEATGEMLNAVHAGLSDTGIATALWRAMSATGDLTNPPEKKP